jgi:hypothetical protein
MIDKDISLKSLWIYFLAPLIGGILAGIFNLLNEIAMDNYNKSAYEFV